MQITRTNVEQYAKNKGLEPIQIDGIPEGFSFKVADVVIGSVEHKGGYIAFIPGKAESLEKSIIKAQTEQELYNKYAK